MGSPLNPLVKLGQSALRAETVKEVSGRTLDFLKGPDIPKPPTPEAPVEKGQEGVRRGEMQRQTRRRALGQIYMTRGQARGTGSTLGSQGMTLG